ncbi:MAG: DUF1289 domain-containing protein [Pseudomonadota bacterium]
MSGKVPSPCVDICKYKRAGHCIACGMTKVQKKKFKKIDGGKRKRAFLIDLMRQHDELGGFPMWPRAYRKRCRKKGVACPLDEMCIPETKKAA